MMKCRAQADKMNFTQYRKAFTQVWKNKGLKGVYQGWWVTALRDVPCCGLWFWTYETLCRNLINKDDSAKRKYSIKVLAGGLAGVMDWIPTYPLDVVKTKIQIDKGPKTPTIAETIVKYYQMQGPRFFFKGIIPT